MVNIYVANCTILPDPLENPIIMDGLSEYRKQKIMKQRNILGRKQSLAAGLLLKEVLFRYGCAEKEVSYGTHGKPEIEGLHFNLSHSGDYAVCAVGESAIGCDIEKVKESSKKVAGRYFGMHEQEILNQITEAKYDETFFRIWTLKEAYVKMTGEGMHTDFRSFDMKMGKEVEVFQNGVVQNCQFKEYCLGDYRIAVCSQEKTFAEQLEIIKLDVAQRE